MKFDPLLERVLLFGEAEFGFYLILRITAQIGTNILIAGNATAHTISEALYIRTEVAEDVI